MNLDPKTEQAILANPLTVMGKSANLAIEPPEGLDESEKRFQVEVVKEFRGNGWKVFYVTNSRMSVEGWPDVFAVKHRAVAMELKVLPNVPTPKQLSWLESMAAAGIDSHLFYPADWPAIVAIAREVPRGKKGPG